MAKYSFEFKKKVVLAYIRGEGGGEYLAKRFNIAHRTSIDVWVRNYKAFGDKGLKRSRKNDIYTFEFKLHVVELYLSTEVSYRALALSQGINNPALLTKWVNDFRNAGADALRPKKKGRKNSLGLIDKKKNIPPSSAITPADANSEQVKQLQDENLKLRIENAYLKELRRLRLEDEARLREQQQSFTASENTLN